VVGLGVDEGAEAVGGLLSGRLVASVRGREVVGDGSYLVQSILIHLRQVFVLHVRLLERGDAGICGVERALHGGQGGRVGVS